MEGLRATARAIKPDALIIGEVWEDASNKISYGQRRGYLQGAQLDGVTNYPWRDAIIGFLRGDSDAPALREAVETLLEHYPLPAVRSLMNILGTHDTVRIINALACTQAEFAQGKPAKARHRLDAPRRAQAKRLLMLAAALQYFLPGSPCVYYGDELALEGFEDPLNRAPFPWGRKSLARAPLRVSRSAWAALKPPRPRKRRYLYSQPDLDMLECYRALGRMRRQYRDFFAQGTFAVEQAQGRVFICAWRWGERCLRLRVNAASEPLAVREPGESTHVAGARYATGGAPSALPGSRFAITLCEQPEPADT